MAALLCVFRVLLKHLALFTDADHGGNGCPSIFNFARKKGYFGRVLLVNQLDF